MTTLRKNAMELLEQIPEDKLTFVIQIMQGVNGLLADVDKQKMQEMNLEQFVIPTERGQRADAYNLGITMDDI